MLRSACPKEANVAEEHRHPVSGRVVYGELLKTGETLRETDVFDSATGTWEPCPIPGCQVFEGCTAIWVRPAPRQSGIGTSDGVAQTEQLRTVQSNLFLF